MIKHIWSVLAQRSVVDSQSNNLSIFDVLERLEIDFNPMPGLEDKTREQELNIPISYQIISLWSKTEEKKEVGIIQISIKNTKGREKVLLISDLTIPEDKIRMRSINQIQGLPIDGSGTLNFLVKVKQADEKEFKEVAELPLEVHLNINKAAVS